MSRSGKPREQETASLPNVKYVKGNCLKKETFVDYVQDIEGIIHCVGTLIEKKGRPELSYNAMNRDSCIFMAEELNKVGEK